MCSPPLSRRPSRLPEASSNVDYHALPVGDGHIIARRLNDKTVMTHRGLLDTLGMEGGLMW